MSFTYFFNDASDLFGIERNADLYAQNGALPGNNYDYVIDFSGVFNEMFNVKTYQQNSANADLYDVDLTINRTYVEGMANATTMVEEQASLNVGILQSSQTLGTRVLEVLALKIFGHARARAAIANDNEIVVGLASDLANHVQAVVTSHRNDIFNQYVQQDLAELNANDMDTPVSFNFQDDKLVFPGYITGSLMNKSGLSADLLNGPTDASTHQVVNGDYNIPILLRLC